MKMRRMIKSELFIKSRFYCEYCGVDLLAHQRLFESVVLDHLRPRRFGGADSTENRCVTCAACDRIKGGATTETIEQARELVAHFRIGLDQWFHRFRAEFRGATGRAVLTSASEGHRAMDDLEDDFEDEDDDEPVVPCPYCKREIHEEAQRCPYCEHYISDEDAPAARKPWWLVAGVIVCLYIVFRWVVG